MPITKNDMSWELDLTSEMEGLSRSEKTELKSEVGKLIVDEIERTTRNRRSPVDGSAYQPLSKEYKAIKRKLGKGGTANLHLNNDMIAAIKNKNTQDGVKIDTVGAKQKLKLFNHNTGDTLPQRRVLPDDANGEFFNQTIMKKVSNVIKKFKSANISERDLAEILRKQQIEGEPEGTAVTLTLSDVINGS